MSDATWIDDPDAQRWARHVLDDVVPKLGASALTLSLVPKEPADIKFAVELGLSLMMDKPILVVCAPGQRVPSRLRLIADDVIEIDFDDPAARARGGAAIAAAIKQIIGDDGASD